MDDEEIIRIGHGNDVLSWKCGNSMNLSGFDLEIQSATQGNFCFRTLNQLVVGLRFEIANSLRLRSTSISIVD